MHTRFFLLAVVAISTTIVSGCGNPRELEKTVAEKQATIDKLEAEAKNLTAETSRLTGRIRDLEQANGDANQRAAQLEAGINSLRSELERMKSLAKPGDPAGAYRNALKMFIGGKYAEAASQFQWLINSGIGDPLEDNCHYWIGESYFAMGRYVEAIEAFSAVLAYEHSNKKEDSQIMIARSHFKNGDGARAKQEYQKLVDTYPASPYVDKARERALGGHPKPANGH